MTITPQTTITPQATMSTQTTETRQATDTGHTPAGAVPIVDDPALTEPACGTSDLPLVFRPADPETDAGRVHRWLTHPGAHHWQMGHLSRGQVRRYLEQITDDDAQDAWIGEEAGDALVYVETYDPTRVVLTDVHDAETGDLGMHLLVAPAPQDVTRRRHGLTSAIMRAVVAHCWSLGAGRLVVEPDVENGAVRRKNREVGFEELREIALPDKRAMLSVLARGTRPEAAAAGVGTESVAGSAAGSVAGVGSGGDAGTQHLRPEHMALAQRHLVAKALAEFSHEKLLSPVAEKDRGEPAGAAPLWRLEVPGASTYRFRARRLALDHWVLDEESLQRLDAVHGHQRPLDAQELIVELQHLLGIPEDLLGTYLEEVAATLASAAFKNRRGGPSAAQLARGRRDLDVAGDLQHTEAGMTEGHPCFVATNGRIGFSVDDLRAYAPESGATFRYVWVAARRAHTRLDLGAGRTEAQHWELELGAAGRARLHARLHDLGLDPADYVLLPVHPWQFRHRVAVSFAPDIARRDLVVLGEGPGAWQPQQSIRTAFDVEHPERSYIKTALSIQNMGFLRGLSPAYMRATPAINDWVAAQVRGDARLAELGFDVLREHAAIGYTGDAYHRAEASSHQQKMLAALWRESPIARLGEREEPDDRLMTMAALLHRDARGASMAAALIEDSGLKPRAWLGEYLRAYLLPVLHCLEVHELAFMPHGENIILRLREGRVTGVFMKDIGEEAAVIGDRELDEDISRMRHVIDDDEAAQLIFTDVFGGVLRHLAGVLHADGVLTDTAFWEVVSQVVAEQEARGEAEGVSRRRRLDLRVPRYAHSCLNRLQLRNTRHMVDLADASGSLIHAGELENPIAG
ncbi:GNAT family N-acetyltransferase [Nesterenkonia sp. K-15-9-6]|uniref:GNAT family N-acetyltransferase n=1 Tax=Nesterenkonia sp. K-15-9-6 TaxID=3093918 RepID=UPI004044AE03